MGVGECDRPIVPLRGLRLLSGWGIWGDRAIEICDTSSVDRSSAETENWQMSRSKQKILRALGHLVKQRRTALGISQEELGMRANLDRTYISGVERGVRNPSITAIASLASGLDTTVSNLLENLEIEAENIE